MMSWLYERKVENFSSLPVVGFTSKSAPYLRLLLFAALHVVYARHPRALIALAPLMALEVTVFFAPVVLFRYVAPIVFCAPMVAACLANPASTDDISRPRQ